MTHDATTRSKSTERSHAPSMVAILRSLMPNRPLTFSEACRIAELQATRLLALQGIADGPVPDDVITTLPRIRVRWVPNLVSSGMSSWNRGWWHIRVNTAEPAVRQRFTLAHELKHVLDAAHEDVAYGHLPAGIDRERHIEAVCDHFAASLLMPRPWVKRHWCSGTQDLMTLAWTFQVSQQAMLIRLQALGLVAPLPRCASWPRLGKVAVNGSKRPPSTYRRASGLHLSTQYFRSFHSRLVAQSEGALT